MAIHGSKPENQRGRTLEEIRSTNLKQRKQTTRPATGKNSSCMTIDRSKLESGLDQYELMPKIDVLVVFGKRESAEKKCTAIGGAQCVADGSRPHSFKQGGEHLSPWVVSSDLPLLFAHYPPSCTLQEPPFPSRVCRTCSATCDGDHDTPHKP